MFTPSYLCINTKLLHKQIICRDASMVYNLIFVFSYSVPAPAASPGGDVSDIAVQSCNVRHWVAVVVRGYRYCTT